MKNKKAVYFLLPVVLFIWSAIFYRIYTGTGSETEAGYRNTSMAGDHYELPEKKEYSLLLDYPDPFSAGYAVPKTTVKPKAGKEQRKKIPDVKKEQAPKAGYDWRGVSFLGTIENSDKKKSLALLKVDGTSYMLSEGVLQDGMEVLWMSTDSVQIKIGKETAYIKKNNGI